jgi:hypothetical protein
MMTSRSTNSIAVAAAMLAIGAVSISAPATAAPAGDAKAVHCYGINSCKGTSDCKTAKNDCKGQNECKGQGFKAVSVAACTAAGGSQTEK